MGQGAGNAQWRESAVWRGHLDQLLPARSKVRRVVHHPAMPYSALPASGKAASPQRRHATGSRVHHFDCLRTGEVLGAKLMRSISKPVCGQCPRIG